MAPFGKAVLIAGTHSGCGKTTVALALMAAFSARGLQVQPFKAGPDFIDPGLHARATGRQSHNLDGWMLDRERCRELFSRYSAEADLVIVEGVMGLFDGASGMDERGSTAELAKWLDLPVLLVVDVRSMARSVAALVQGYAGFDPALHMAGVLLNRVGSTRHEELLLEALQASLQVPVAGCLPRREGLVLPSRHLGLHTAEEGALPRELLRGLQTWAEESLELTALLDNLPCVSMKQTPPFAKPPRRRIRLGVARDKAFCFYYQENLRLLEESGAEIVLFSPLEDAELPAKLQGLYFGGGYPELYAAQLSDNTALRQDVLRFARSGGMVYGECGGFMYLMQGLQADAASYPMVGVFAMHCRMEPRLRSLGYRQVTTTAPSPLGAAGCVLRGHEFHYSHLVGMDPEAASVYAVSDRKDRACETAGCLRQNALGSYVHLHFASAPSVAAAIVAACAGQSLGEDHDR